MLYQVTGQPGHGKTLNAIKDVLEMKDHADKLHAQDPSRFPHRELIVINVREFDYAKTGASEVTPEEFKGWADHPDYIARRDAIKSAPMSAEERKKALQDLERDPIATEFINPRFHNAIILIDECYEHGIFPRRRPGAELPRHVERVAKHRHHGLDIVMVCQSPDKQTDDFLHDLIEEHRHVRRMFGTKVIQIRKFDKFQKDAERATPIAVTRGTLPKRAMGLYKSTILDTTQRRIPWYWIAMPFLLVVGGGYIFWTFSTMDERLLDGEAAALDAKQGSANSGVAAGGAVPASKTPEQFINQFMPRIPSQPWSAPAYDGMSVSREPPRVFCMIGGSERTGTCTCLTEQGTRYVLDLTQCRFIARHGQYEPFLEERQDGEQDVHTVQHDAGAEAFAGEGQSPSAMTAAGVAPVSGTAGQPVAAYGGFRSQANPSP